jgi:hypothetical protein
VVAVDLLRDAPYLAFDFALIEPHALDNRRQR